MNCGAWADQPEDLARPAKLVVALAKVTGASMSQMMRMAAIVVTVIEPETAQESFPTKLISSGGNRP